MLEVVREHLPAVQALCRRYRVEQMDLFGSAVKGTFDPGKSDLDFLVAFERKPNDNAAVHYFDLLLALEDLFGRKVDLVDVRAARNPYFVAEILKHRVNVYAA
ncbi:MAG TPA: nucleotidyltransferase domain-containing protein [Tepidisphaeraceae bacterium]|jgi:hypothetical protein